MTDWGLSVSQWASSWGATFFWLLVIGGVILIGWLIATFVERDPWK